MPEHAGVGRPSGLAAVVAERDGRIALKAAKLARGALPDPVPSTASSASRIVTVLRAS